MDKMVACVQEDLGSIPATSKCFSPAVREEIKGGGMVQHSTEVAYLLLIQQPQVGFLAVPRIFILVLLRFIEWTEASLCQSNPSSTGLWQDSTTKSREKTSTF